MPTPEGKPVVLVVTNIPAWINFKEVIGDRVEICSNNHDPYEGYNEAHKLGGPDIIAIGCICNGGDNCFGSMYTNFIKMVRKPMPDGPGFSGPIIGLCEVCARQHLDAGCDEVVQFGRDAATRILEIIQEDSAA